ncbi:lysis protein [Klebsiella pneumoniae]|uniref:lysis protein n=1 Tax=Klebsiella pneumoniae TaxID=573 RepID=UPI0025A4CFC3|nr:lysis protein [Klebsiella pneumoniae]EIX9323168.1 lysis protein [Klebsiella pneumoniae]EKU6111547.1 lysis protein [Klebsiella pneumoniae]WJQ47700.1 lysis protein [Klebsiella pneumoniae]HBT4862794.1 lysis protein [Klebsiella pneumoniae]
MTAEAILALVKKFWLPAIIAVLIGALAISASHYKGKAEQEKQRADGAEHSLKLANATIIDMQTRQRDVAELDAKYTKELADAQNTINGLRRDVDSGAKRLRIAATCPGVSKATSATGVDDAGAPELTPDAQWNYFDLRDGIATADKMIRGMQDYIKEQCLR